MLLGQRLISLSEKAAQRIVNQLDLFAMSVIPRQLAAVLLKTLQVSEKNKKINSEQRLSSPSIKIKVRVASRFQPKLAIGLSLFHF